MFISYITFINPNLNENLIHSQLYSIFPANAGRILYKKETILKDDCLNTVAIVFSEKKPEFMETVNVKVCECKEVEPVFKQHEQFKFTIKLNPTFCDGEKRSPQKSIAKRYDFVRRKFENAGATVLGTVTEGRREFFDIHHAKGRQTITAYTYTGTLKVDDTEKFQQAYKKGIGHCKAYGCGMLLLKRC